MAATTKIFAVGDRVLLRGSHSHAGEAGTIKLNPTRAFNGWTVKLDSGHWVGVGNDQMLVVPRDPETQRMREWIGATVMMVELGATDQAALDRIVETGQAFIGAA